MTLAKSLQAAAGNAAAEGTYIEDVFSTYLYTGNGATQTITNGIDLAGEGGAVWIKNRSTVDDHVLFNTVSGPTKMQRVNTTDAQETVGTDVFQAFNSDGFRHGGWGGVGGSGNAIASWTFRKQPKFFDVVTYTGDGVAGRQISHALGSAPGFILIKSTSSVSDWSVYHRSLGATQGMTFNSTYFAYDAASFWNNTAPTSSVFTVGTDSTINQNGQTYVAYLFAHNAGGFGESGEDNVVSCGSFSTAASGYVSVDLGYEPQFVLWKKTSATQNWNMADNMRGFTSSSANLLYPNLTLYETEGALIRTTATGFEIDSAYWGASSDFIYIAIRRGPMKVPTLGTSVFAPIARTGTGTVSSTTGLSFPPDMLLGACRSDASGGFLYDKLRGVDAYLTTNNDGAEYIASGEVNSFNMDGITFGTNPTIQVTNVSARTYANWNFRRAPGFFDEVCYTGTGSATTVAHNLAKVPELMIVKSRSDAEFWAVYNTTTGNNASLSMNENPVDSPSGFWNTTTPTSSVFSLGVGNRINGSAKTYVAYLFATCAGVSKVGSYTGTATTKQIDCGFTGGARFVLIKRTDSAGNWYVWDSARGIVSGNDPYLLLDLTDAEVTTTDYIDPVSSGFEISSTAPAAINASGGSYIFLAIA